MIRNLLLAAAVVAPVLLPAQAKDIRITPNWIPGDVRAVHTTMDLRMQGDSMRVHMTGSGSYHLKVVDRKKDRSVLGVVHTADDVPMRMRLDASEMPVDVQVAMEQVNRVMDVLLDTLMRPMRGIRLDFNLGPQAEVLGMVPDEGRKLKVLDAMVEATTPVLNELARLSPDARKPSKPELYHLSDSLYDGLLETMRNEIALLLDGYGYSYPATGTRREPGMVKDVQAPLHPDWPELPAMMEYGFDEIDADHAVCRVVLQYDQAALKAELEKDGDKVERVGLSEERVYRFDRRTGWLTSANTSVTMVLDAMRIFLVTRTDIKGK